MAKFPLAPAVERLRGLTPPTRRLAAGTRLARIGFAGGDHPTRWNQFRHWGPTQSRFDHQTRDRHGRPQLQQRGVYYCAAAAQTCIAEVYQATRVVDVLRHQPYLAVWALAVDLMLLDLTGAFVTRMGASTAIHSGPRVRAQEWAAALYSAYDSVDGFAYCSSMNGNAVAYVLNERALRKRPFPRTPDFHRTLADPLIADLIDAAADTVGYLVKR